MPIMKRHLLSLACLLSLALCTRPLAQESSDAPFPVRGLCLSAPRPNRLDAFVRFIHEQLAPRSVNTLVLRVDYNFDYASHPELRDGTPLTKADVAKLVAACKEHQIRVIPHLNLLGHQSWAKDIGNLLRVYPDFDETPWIKMPEKYQWPNPDGLYCKSYCPLHPKVHDVVFALMDELCDAFEADTFHAGMDEVFYLGEAKCPRCVGKDKAELFAGEVARIRDHLKERNRTLWIWGDRLLDGKTTGLGEWEAAMNDTHRAVDLIPKDVVICDWHYDRPDQTAVYFAMKGLSVITCPWRNPKNGALQVQDLVRFREHSTPVMKKRFLGIVQTVWSGPEAFLAEVDRAKAAGPGAEPKNTAGECFVAVMEEIGKQKAAVKTPAK